jgi:hypothetical protein
MSAAPVSRNQDNLQKMLSQAMTKNFSAIVEKNGLRIAEQKINIDAESNLAHILLTISGLQFRAVVLLHFPKGKSAVHFLNLFSRDERSTKLEKDIEPFYTEEGNQFCGEIKRHLYKQFDHLGMSTPFMMSAATALTDLSNELLRVECHQFYQLKDQIVLGGSLYVFANQPLEFDFANDSGTEQISTGELEFF